MDGGRGVSGGGTPAGSVWLIFAAGLLAVLGWMILSLSVTVTKRKLCT